MKDFIEVLGTTKDCLFIKESDMGKAVNFLRALFIGNGIECCVKENGLITPQKKPLKTLEEHNATVTSFHQTSNKPCWNGIKCPECGAELYDNNDGTVLMSYPPWWGIHCKSCDYKGSRY